ncbi:hypothetical protein IPM09_02075 [Candidatus Saccharibacteria bacterium]|nr:MAG: hypothetical protein IPM09_02075 [Candidatus Saccharibacteria bacterium]
MFDRLKTTDFQRILKGRRDNQLEQAAQAAEADATLLPEVAAMLAAALRNDKTPSGGNN